jgi:hypothetical protein
MKGPQTLIPTGFCMVSGHGQHRNMVCLIGICSLMLALGCQNMAVWANSLLAYQDLALGMVWEVVVR